jgi:hypothetical protein
LLSLAPFSTFTFIQKHSGNKQRITVLTPSKNQTPGRIRKSKCRRKEILRESAKITEGRRLKFKGMTSGTLGFFLYYGAVCLTAYRACLGMGNMNDRSE